MTYRQMQSNHYMHSLSSHTKPLIQMKRTSCKYILIVTLAILLPTYISAHNSISTGLMVQDSAVTAGLSIDSCLSLARLYNKDIQRATLNINKAQQVKQQALTKYFPQVQAMAIGYHSLHPMLEMGIDDIDNASVRDLLVTLYGNYGAALGLDNHISLFQYGYIAGVTAMQPISMGGKIVNGNQLAQVGVDAARLQAEITQRDILQQVEESYWLLAGLLEKQTTLTSVINLLDTIHRTVDTAFHAGLVLQTDLLQVELKQSEVQRTQIQLVNGIALARRALAQSIGIDKDSPLYYASLNIEPLQDTGELLIVSSHNQITSGPESDLLSLQVQAAKLQKRVTMADALPQIAIGASYGYSNLQTNILREGFGSKTGNGSVFFTLAIPITGWWEMGHKIQEHDITIRQVLLQQEQMTQMLALRNQQAYDKMLEAYLLVKEYERACRTAQENYRLMSVNYRAGMVTIADLLSAQTTLMQSHNQLTDARIAFRVNTRKYLTLTQQSETL